MDAMYAELGMEGNFVAQGDVVVVGSVLDVFAGDDAEEFLSGVSAGLMDATFAGLEGEGNMVVLKNIVKVNTESVLDVFVGGKRS